jgi:DNA-binding response OmpR family regulator
MTSEYARLLIVDDEAALRETLEVGLLNAGFTVRCVGDGQEALRSLSAWAPDLILLDVMLPEIDGFTLLPELRKQTDIPIIMLSARSQTEEKITGLSRGADDYISKPFSLPELITRVHTALRRPRIERREILTHGNLRLDVERRCAFRGERYIELSAREYDLLLALMNQPGHIFSRSELLDRVWGFERYVYANTLEAYISYLRAKIDSGEEHKLIHTLRGVGYMLKYDNAP